MTKVVNDWFPEIKTKGEAMDLILDVEGEKFLVAGFEGYIKELEKFIEEKSKEGEKKATANAEKKVIIGGEVVQKEITLSTFHRSHIKEIEEKAEELELILDTGYDVVLVTGSQSNIGLFIAYLYEKESEIKKSLYPKYWDFHEVNAFSMAEIPATSDEYKQVVDLFFNSLPNRYRILSLKRIQNKYLMDHYVTNIMKRKELKPNEPLNRMLLFHGTRQTDPKIIYKSFDVGFDLQYAAHGMFGKGLYFAVNSSYSDGGFVHVNKKGVRSLIIADVYVGKSKVCPGGNYIKAPEGYDSVEAQGQNFYIVYNNFHSYPLYLLEYQ